MANAKKTEIEIQPDETILTNVPVAETLVTNDGVGIYVPDPNIATWPDVRRRECTWSVRLLTYLAHEKEAGKKVFEVSNSRYLQEHFTFEEYEPLRVEGKREFAIDTDAEEEFKQLDALLAKLDDAYDEAKVKKNK